MKIIGITGKSGSGKTTLGLLLSQKLKGLYIDIDKICHEAYLQPSIIEKMCKEFGTEILDENGNIDRKKVGNIVFAEKSKMEVVVNLTWGYMQNKLDCILEQGHETVILDGNLLPNSKYWDKCDYKILTKTNDELRKQKILQRDKITKEYLEKRESSGIDYSIYKFDYILENDYQEKTINDMAENIIEKLKKA